MKVLITGASGQLGQALQKTAPQDAQIIAADRQMLDISDDAAISRLLQQSAPDLVINAAAYTAVDKAESEREAAHAINAHAAGHLAREARRLGARFVHVSTDFVFDGQSAEPYAPDAPTAPLSVYGASKLAGEQLVLDAHAEALVLRTAWVYLAGGQNFVATMLRLMRERPELRVVADQIGTPTHATSLARAIWTLDGAGAHGIHHWTDAGVASWYDFAVAIAEEAQIIGLIDRSVSVVPIRSRDYPTPARRPALSVLDKESSWAITGPARHWRAELRLALREMKEME